MRLILAPEALDDLEAILLYTLQKWGDDQQDRYADAIEKGLSVLLDHPTIGRNRPEILAGCRSYRIREHIVYYAIEGEEVRIARILHGRMDALRYL